MWVLTQVQVKWCPEQPDLVGDGDVPDHGQGSLDLHDWCPILWFCDSMTHRKCSHAELYKSYTITAIKQRKLFYSSCFPTWKGVEEAPELLPLKMTCSLRCPLFLSLASPLFWLLLSEFLCFFLFLKFKCDASPALCCPRSHPREPRKTPAVITRHSQNSGRACGCALNLPLHVIKFNDFLSLLWQRNKGSSSLGRCFPNIGFALFTALSVFGRPVITQGINISSVFKVVRWTFT